MKEAHHLEESDSEVADVKLSRNKPKARKELKQNEVANMVTKAKFQLKKIKLEQALTETDGKLKSPRLSDKWYRWC